MLVQHATGIKNIDLLQMPAKCFILQREEHCEGSYKIIYILVSQGLSKVFFFKPKANRLVFGFMSEANTCNRSNDLERGCFVDRSFHETLNNDLRVERGFYETLSLAVTTL